MWTLFSRVLFKWSGVQRQLRVTDCRCVSFRQSQTHSHTDTVSSDLPGWAQTTTEAEAERQEASCAVTVCIHTVILIVVSVNCVTYSGTLCIYRQTCFFWQFLSLKQWTWRGCGRISISYQTISQYFGTKATMCESTFQRLNPDPGPGLRPIRHPISHLF